MIEWPSVGVARRTAAVLDALGVLLVESYIRRLEDVHHVHRLQIALVDPFDEGLDEEEPLGDVYLGQAGEGRVVVDDVAEGPREGERGCVT